MTKWSVVAELLRPVVVVAVVVVNCRRNEDGKTTSFVLNAAGYGVVMALVSQHHWLQSLIV